MVHVGIFFLALFSLFLLSRRLTRGLSFFLYKLTRKEEWAVGILAFLFLPGTILHELSHYVTAIFLGVHAGKMEFRPEVHGKSVKMGSVSIAKTDIVRRFLIGVAPLVWGLGVIICILYFVTSYGVFTNLFLSFVALLVICIVGNTMYSSRRDMEGAVGLIILVGILFVFIGGFFLYSDTSLPEIRLPFLDSGKIFQIFETGWKFLLVPVIVDVVLVAILHFIIRK